MSDCFQTSLRKLHLTACDVNYARAGLYIYIHRAVFVVALVYRNEASDLCLPPDYSRPLLEMRKWCSMVRKLSSSTCACWHALHLAFPGSSPMNMSPALMWFQTVGFDTGCYLNLQCPLCLLSSLAQCKCSILKVKVSQLCPTLCHPMDGSPWNSPGQNTGVGRWGLYWLLWAIFSSLTLMYFLYTIITAIVVFLFVEMWY